MSTMGSSIWFHGQFHECNECSVNINVLYRSYHPACDNAFKLAEATHWEKSLTIEEQTSDCFGLS